MAEEASEQLLADVKRSVFNPWSTSIVVVTRDNLLKDDDYSDLIITCGANTYKVHKVIVCKRSEFFTKAVKFGKEAAEGRVDLPEDDPAVIKLLIDYLYEAEYEPRLEDIDTPPVSRFRHTCMNKYRDHYATLSGIPATPLKSCSAPILCPHHACGVHCQYTCKDFVCDICHPRKTNAPPDQLLTHAKMYEIADKYHVSGLKELSMRKFQRACDTHWNHLKFPEAVAYVFSTTPDEDKGLRDIVTKTISKNMCLLNKPEVETLMMQFKWSGIRTAQGKVTGVWLDEEAF